MKKKRIWGRGAKKKEKEKENLGIGFLASLLFLTESGEMLVGFSALGVGLPYCIFYYILPRVSLGLDSNISLKKASLDILNCIEK